MQQYLTPSRFVDSDHPGVIKCALNHRGDGGTPLQRAVALYYAVRDTVRYNPYVFSRDPQTLKASPRVAGRAVLLRAQGHAAGGVRAGTAASPRASAWPM